MFRSPAPNLIESDEGYSVERNSLSEITYREAGKELSAFFEYLTGPIRVSLSLSSIKAWKHPCEAEQIDYAERRRIANNIASALRSQALTVEIVEAGVSDAWAPNPNTTAPKDGRPIRGKFREKSTGAVGLWGVRWSAADAAWTTPFGKVVTDDWILEAWGGQLD